MKMTLLAILLGSVFAVQTANGFVGADGYRYSDEDIQSLLWVSIGAREKAEGPIKPLLVHDGAVSLLSPIYVHAGETPTSRVKFAVQEFYAQANPTRRFILPIVLGRHWMAMVVATNKYGLVALDFLDSVEEVADLTAMKIIRKTIHKTLGGTLHKEFVRDFCCDKLDLALLQGAARILGKGSCS